MEEVTKLYSITCMANNNLAVSVGLKGNKSAVRIYDSVGANLLHTICQDKQDHFYLGKPQYLVATGNLCLRSDHQLNVQYIQCIAIRDLC